MKTLRIDRSMHLTGDVLNRLHKLLGTTFDSALLSSHAKGMKCCLGFGCVAAGLPDDQITERAYPSDGDVVEGFEPLLQQYFGSSLMGWLRPVSSDGRFNYNVHHPFSTVAMINDDQALANDVREAQIIAWFADNSDIAVEFYGDYPTDEELKQRGGEYADEMTELNHREYNGDY